MTPTAIVSYDDTLNDLDALMLARVFADAGTRRNSRSTTRRCCSTAAPGGWATWTSTGA